MSWTWILALAAGAYGFKALGVFVIGSRSVAARVAPFTSLAPAAMLAALIVVQTVGSDGRLVLDARLLGVAVAIVTAWRRAPFTVVVLAAMAATALLRLIS